MSDVATGFVCEYCDRQFSTERGALLHEQNWCTANPNASGRMRGRPKKDDSAPAGEVPEAPAEAAPVESSPFVETAPEEKSGWRAKLWGAAPERPAASSAKATLERAPRRRRKSTEGIWQLLVTGIGQGLVATRADVPVGNALLFQGPVVGPIVDKAIAGTFVDTLLQPLAGAGERFEDVGDVIALPTLVGIMERAPQLAPALEPLLRKAIRRHLVEYARIAKAQRKADTEYRKALEDLGMEPEGDDPVEGIIAQIWAGAPAPAESMNGQAADADVRP